MLVAVAGCKLGDRDERGSTLVAMLVGLLVVAALIVPATMVVYAAQRPGGDKVQEARIGSPRASCTADARTIEGAIEAVKAQTGSYPTTIAEMVGAFIVSAPSTARYTIALGSNTATGASGPKAPASAPAGAPADWPVGRVLVAPGPPPVGATSYRLFNGADNTPCDDPAIR